MAVCRLLSLFDGFSEPFFAAAGACIAHPQNRRTSNARPYGSDGVRWGDEALSRVRRNSLHSISPVSVGAGEIPYPLLPSSFPTQTRSAGLCVGFLGRVKLPAFHFPGFLRSRGNSISAPSFFLSDPNPLRWALCRFFGGNEPLSLLLRKSQLPLEGEPRRLRLTLARPLGGELARSA